MADESFVLSLVGQLDKDSTINNVETILKEINKKFKESDTAKIKIFDKEELDRQGAAYLSGVENIKAELVKMFNTENFSIAEIFDDKGNLAKFKVNLEGLLETFKSLNFEAAKFSDGSAGFVLSNGNQNTIQQLQETQKQAERTTSAIGNVPKGFNEANWGNVTQSFVDIKDFLRVYQETIGKFSGNPNMNLNLDKDGNIRGFTADIKDANGALETMRFRLQNLGDKDNPDWQYVYQGSNVKDNVFEQQAKSLTVLEDKLAKFKKQVNDGVTFKFIDINQTNEEISNLEATLDKLKKNVGNNTTTQMEAIQNSMKVAIETATETERVEKKRQTETDKTNKQLDQQYVKLQKNRALLKSFLETKVNPNSASFVGNSDKLDDVIAKLQEVIKIRAELAAKNKSGEILSEKDLGRLTVGLTELRNLFSEARKESGQAIDRNESTQKLAKDIESVNARLDANIAKWKNMGVYAGQFKDDVDKLKKTLNEKDASGTYLVDSSNRLRELEKDMGIYNSRALELQRSNKVVSNSIQDVSERIDLYKEKMKTLELRYADLTQYSGSFRTTFESVKKSLENVKTPEELRNWEQSFKKMNEAAKQTEITLRNSIKTDDLSQKIALLKQQINAFEQSNPRAANIYIAVFERLKSELEQVANNGDLKRIQNEFRSLKLTIDQAGVSGKTFGQRMQDAFKRMSSYLGVTSMMMYTVRAIREMINNVKELDTQMVRLRRVTDETDTTYKNMFNNAIDSAKRLNTSVSNIIESTANLSKMNFDPATAARLADLVNMFDKVAEINNVEESTNALVSIINGFTDLTADDAERIVDVMDNLGNKFAVSARDLSEILKRSSASLSEANNSIEESVAMGTVAQTIAQDSSKVGKIYADYKFYSKR